MFIFSQAPVIGGNLYVQWKPEFLFSNFSQLCLSISISQQNAKSHKHVWKVKYVCIIQTYVMSGISLTNRPLIKSLWGLGVNNRLSFQKV